MPVDVISSAQMIERDLPAVWEWFDHKRDLLKQLQPNPAHVAIAGWQKVFPNLTLVTQNIDGLHQKAGSRDVVELHGNIWRARCIECAMRVEVPSDSQKLCVGCGNNLRPDVVLFGELLPPGAYERAAAAAAACDLCFVVGTSALVYPAANLPTIAKVAGAYLVEVNPEITPLSDFCDEVLTGKAGEVLPYLTSI
jgi:NAD-dependent deacetylase